MNGASDLPTRTAVRWSGSPPGALKAALQLNGQTPASASELIRLSQMVSGARWREREENRKRGRGEEVSLGR